MMSTRRLADWVVFSGLGASLTISFSACASRSDRVDLGAGNGSDGLVVENIGILRGDLVGIRGETTGWRLESGEREEALELDVAAVLEKARALSGYRVRVRGVMVDRDWPERASVPALIARSLERVQ